MARIVRPTVALARLHDGTGRVLSITARGRQILVHPRDLPAFADDLNDAVRRLAADQQEQPE